MYEESITAPACVEVDFDTLPSDADRDLSISSPQQQEITHDEACTEVDFDNFEPANLDGFSDYPRHGLCRAPRLRSTILTQETWRLYNASSFLIWQTGLYFNAHLVLTARDLGYQDWNSFSRDITKFNKELHRCLFDGTAKAQARSRSGRPSMRISRRSVDLVDHPHYWMSVIEHARDHGVHAHQLFVVPKASAQAVELKVRDWWSKNAPGPVCGNAIHFRAEHPLTDQRRYNLHVKWFQYITKSTEEKLVIRDPEGKVWSAREIFKPDPNNCTPVVLRIEQLAQISHRLSSKAQETAGFISKYGSEEFDQIYSHWEKDALANRRRLESFRRLSTLRI